MLINKKVTKKHTKLINQAYSISFRFIFEFYYWP
jgi:hypothetical protein